MTTNDFRSLPSVDKIISSEPVHRYENIYPHDFIVSLTRKHLTRERLSLAAGNSPTSVNDIINSICAELDSFQSSGLRPLVNATGVVLHTNLGRSPLSQDAIAAMEQASHGYSNLEFDVEMGTRGTRQVHVESLLCTLTGAEAALVVNSNAAGVLLGLGALAKKKEIIVSRGQAVEIGDSFRIPDVMRQSGAKLIEVGTTNCTYLRDYEQAITEHTAGLMRVHSSNFQVVGFTHSVTIQELVDLGRKRDIPVLDDLGSGCFLDTTTFGLAAEPTVQESISAGMGLVFFSGDKLVGGPQAGIIVGKKIFVDRLRKHPLARAVRIDKIRIAGLAVTLIHYLKGEATRKIPVWTMISSGISDIERRATAWQAALGDYGKVINGESMIGGGSLPGATLPTKLLAIYAGRRKKGQGIVQILARKLRENNPPVVARISEDALLLDPRTVFPEEDNIVLAALKSLIIIMEKTS
jgi:L-seryl-tRNA(Ser) seleniumtransferase